MEPLLPRHSLEWAGELLGAFPTVVIQGARQVGKSTFAELLVSGRNAALATLDDERTLEAATDDPAAFVDQIPDGTLVIDELQRAPELILPIKASIDRNRRPGRFVLTGSSDLLRLTRTPDSLAGRAITVNLRTLSQGEIRSRRDDLLGRLKAGADAVRFTTDSTRSDYAEIIARGGYPEVLSVSDRLRASWFDSYVGRLLERDVSDIAPRVDATRLHAVLRLVAANQTGELVKARIARDANVPETSVTTYIDLLEIMYLVGTLRPWTPNLTSRQASKPKAYVTDPGLALRLAKTTADHLKPLANPYLGAAMEGLVVTELTKQRGWSSEEFELFHFRDRTGLEVDIVAEFFDGSVIGIEVKSGSTAKAEHFAGLRTLRDKLGERFLGGYVLNASQQGSFFGDRLRTLPVSALWEL
ncbi:ATP-binding protein [Agromyces sp. NPDC058484]|uniref:ATP-binding protein n=1 Tax=Agromyces sp. NPDC058484 TaxID=3346524 RepID=UPI00365B5C14